MQVFQVDDMTCGHCVTAITKAIQSVDSNAKVATDLGRHLVAVDTAMAEPKAIEAAILAEGYAAVGVSTPTAQETATCSGGCCCGGGASRRAV